MEIEFVNGAVYAYRDVPPVVYQQFLTAESKGRYLAAAVKDKYHFTRLK